MGAWVSKAHCCRRVDVASEPSDRETASVVFGIGVLMWTSLTDAEVGEKVGQILVGESGFQAVGHEGFP